MFVASAVLADQGGSSAYALAPVRLSSSATDVEASGPQVALDARGDAFAVWSETRPSGTTEMAAIRPVGGGWAAPTPLGAGGNGRLAVNARGDAVVVGLASAAASRAFVVYHRAGGRFGPARLLPGTRGGNSLPSVAIDGAGRALVAWSDGKRVRLASRARGSRWSSRVLGQGVDPAVATNPRGDALVLWRPPTNTVDRFVGSWRLHGGPWRRPRTLATPGEGAV